MRKIEHVQGWVDHLGAVLIDVRLSPNARQADFRKSNLEERFGRDRYWHIEELGNVNYRSESGPTKLKDEVIGLEALAFNLRRGPVIIMCGCWNVNECHRKFISDKMAAEWAVEVIHLTKVPPKDEAPEPQLSLL